MALIFMGRFKDMGASREARKPRAFANPQEAQRYARTMAAKDRQESEAVGVFQSAEARLRECDRPAEAADAGWGLWPAPLGLTEALLPKLAHVPRTDVVVTGVLGRLPDGSTRLYRGKPDPANPDDLTDCTAAELSTWLAGHRDAALTLQVKVTATVNALHEGTIVEILNHELAAHVEPFADFLGAETDAPGTGVLGTAVEQHEMLHAGNPRYRLIGARYVTRYADAQSYRNRMQMDTDARATLPPGV
ncbi:hypothetical protein [Streptomyces albipurpureus]|uniref:Uncharacterized protein n=1 Tax=Streptomyces albipurpureus TaxID=2897419 RepID=A0ABT0UPL5_9ACTN|nr:hypothetical protein [Streptomyces sp. CWNU-1]MCM2389934.1 hypothetical protein [Streptomyces sp. CWNU-1]